MPITREELVSLCHSLELSPTVSTDNEETLYLLFETACFVDEGGEKEVVIWCSTGYAGSYLAVAAPRVLNTTGCKYKGALFAAMAEIALQTRYLQLTHNSKTGEVHLEIEFPVMDGTVTAMQLDTMIRHVLQALDHYYPVLTHAMQTGKIDFSLGWEPSE